MRRPHFVAEHARNARGLLGRIIAFIMARETWSQNLRVMKALEIDQNDLILDVGCGHGRSLTELAARAWSGRVVGAAPSELMVEIAAQRNRPLIEAGHVDVVLATVESLPFPDDSFDKVLCVHVIYFWNDLVRRGAPSQTETDRSHSNSLGYAHGGENGRELDPPRMARRTRRCCNTVQLPQYVRANLADERHVESVGQPLCGVAIEHDAIAESILQRPP